MRQQPFGLKKNSTSNFAPFYPAWLLDNNRLMHDTKKKRERGKEKKKKKERKKVDGKISFAKNRF